MYIANSIPKRLVTSKLDDFDYYFQGMRLHREPQRKKLRTTEKQLS